MEQSRNKFIYVIIIGLITTALILSVNYNKIKEVTNRFILDSHVWAAGNSKEVTLEPEDYLLQPDISWEPYKITRKVKAIFMTGHSIGLTERFNNVVKLTGDTVINSWVIDVKDDYGTLTYSSEIPLVKEVAADRIIKVRDFHSKMEVLREKDIYPIARIVTFKDKQVTSSRPDLAIKSKTGQVWRDRKGDSWLNPYNRDSWEYVIDIAKEAAGKGFKEIQFDYVRFPTDGDRSMIDYGSAALNETKYEAIAAFLAHAREELKEYGVYISADIFGLVTTVSDDMGLGQHLETLSTATDILSPMVYPSHYALGTYGVPKPDFDPYTIVYTSMNRARERIEAVDTAETKAKLRPWLQDFTASYLGQGYYKTYGVEEVKAQIKATYDAGLEEWILWNAGNRYTWDALVK